MTEELRLKRLATLTEALRAATDEWTKNLLKVNIERLKRSEK